MAPERHQANARRDVHQGVPASADDTPGPRSQAVQRVGKFRCELCNRKGSDRNYLSLHHIDGNPKNNHPNNKMAVHRYLCHTFADFITQWHKGHDTVADRAIIINAWRSFNWT